MQGSAQEKQKNVFQPKKRSRFRKSYRRRLPRPLTVSPNISSQTYETEEVRVQTTSRWNIVNSSSVYTLFLISKTSRWNVVNSSSVYTHFLSRIFLKCGRPLYSHQVRSNVKTTTKNNNVCSQVRIHRYQLLVCSVNNKKDRKTSTTQNNAING